MTDRNEDILVAIYCRLSEEDRVKSNEFDESKSIQNQKSLLIKFAQERGWKIYKIYSDEDYQGSDRNRPDFKKLLEDAEARKFHIILCKSQSRFTRELELVEKYINGYFLLWGIRFVSITDNADTDIDSNRKSRQINGLVNEWYLEDLSKNIKIVLDDRRKEGMFIGAFAPYGYMKDPDNHGHLLIDEEAAAVVSEIFQLFIHGIGKNRIAQILNERGIPNATEYKRLKGLRYKQSTTEYSTLWRYYAISDILKNEVYIGNMVQGKYASVSYKSRKNKPVPKDKWIRKNNTHEPIISMDVWQKTQTLIGEKTKPCYTGEIGLWAGKTKCMYCGYSMLSHKQRQYRYLRCGTNYCYKGKCKGGWIAQRELAEGVLEELSKIIHTYLDMDVAAERIMIDENIDLKINRLRNSVDVSVGKLNEMEKAIQTSYLDKINGLITEEECDSFLKKFRQNKISYSTMIKRFNDEILLLENEKQNVVSKREILAQYIDMTTLNRDIIDTLIDFIEIGRHSNKSEKVPFIIHWNF